MVSVAAVSCGRDKYSDLKEFIKQVASTRDMFLSKIDSSSTPDEIVKAVADYSAELVMQIEKSREIAKKHPEILTWGDNPPAELKSDLEKLSDTENKFDAILQKDRVRALVKDRKVQDAFIELNRKLSGAKFFQQ